MRNAIFAALAILLGISSATGTLATRRPRHGVFASS